MSQVPDDVRDRIAACDTWEDLLSAVEGGLRDEGLVATADEVKTARDVLDIEAVVDGTEE